MMSIETGCRMRQAAATDSSIDRLHPCKKLGFYNQQRLLLSRVERSGSILKQVSQS